MERNLLIAAVALLAVGTVTAGAIGVGGIVGDAPANDAGQPTDTDRPSTPATGTDTFAFDGGTPVELEAVEDATVSGTTTLDAGTELSVRVQSADDASPRFFRSVEATVGDDGTFTATFDLGHITAERDVNVSVHAPNATERVAGNVVAPEGGFTEPTESDRGSDPASFDGGEPVELVATDNATLSGTTTAEPGSEVSVRLQSADDGTQFFMTRTATVASDGSFTVHFDLSDIYEQRDVELSVVGDDWRHAESGTIVAPEGGFPDADDVEATIDGEEPIDLAAAANQTVSGSTNLDAGTEVSVELENASDGRLLAVASPTVDENGEFTATVDLSELDAGGDVTIELVVYRETIATADGRVVES